MFFIRTSSFVVKLSREFSGRCLRDIPERRGGLEKGASPKRPSTVFPGQDIQTEKRWFFWSLFLVVFAGSA